MQCPHGPSRCSPKYATSSLTWQPSSVTSETTCWIRSASACSRRSNRSTRRSSEPGRRSGASENGVALSRIGDPKLDQLSLLEVAERRHDPARAPRRGRGAASSGSRLVQMRPALPLANEPAQEVGAVGIECRGDLVERPVHRAEAVARVERRPLPQQALQLEVGENRSSGRAGARRTGRRARTR